MKIRLVFAILFVSIVVPFAAFADEPTITGAVDITAEATSSAGAYVTFAVTATDTDAAPLTPACSPLSDSLFALGSTTTVTCTTTSAVDAASSTTATFDVGVFDTTPPTFTTPSHYVIASSTLSVVPSSAYPTVSDVVDGTITPTYTLQQTDPHTVHVDWSATDQAGNTGTFGSDITTIDPASVTVSDDCTVTDSNGDSHTFAQTGTFLGICALQAAKDVGAISDFVLVNDPGLGLYVQSVNGTSAGATEYWAIWQNEGYTACGLGCLPVAQGDTLSLVLTDWMASTESTGVAFSIDALTATSSVPAPSNSGGGGGGGTVHFNLNVPSALAYLVSQQNADGSFASSLYSDWAALAFAASLAGQADPGAAKTMLSDYLRGSTPALSAVTDYERHAMALMSLGINPYNGTLKDYITPIVNAFDGTQIGDAHLDNDDIFAIFPLMSAGYSPSDPMMKSIVAYILTAQRPDGSWDGSPDMTAAAVQAIGPFFSVPGYGAAMGRAMGYLAGAQQASGGWGGIDSTSWVQTMMNAAKELDPAHAPTFTSSGGRFPMDEIAGAQQQDGAVRPATDSVDNRVWSTSYAVVAASGKSWLTLLQPFSRPSSVGITASGGGVLETTATSTASTSSPQAAATTPPTATSTPEVVSTSTPTVIGTVLGTTTATTTLKKAQPKVSKLKKITVPQTATTSSSTPPASTSQTAAAASAPKSGFLSGLWRSIASFFGRFF
ncbi:MAG: prenyltransferase/squalene oxidase repeat-containing protein [Patescibacteria group bacterium]